MCRFQGFFDFLSFEQYAKDHPELPALRRLDVCVLNSTAIVERSKDFLSRYEKVHASLTMTARDGRLSEKCNGSFQKVRYW